MHAHLHPGQSCDSLRLRAILGNDIAIKAYREGTRPFPERRHHRSSLLEFVDSEGNDEILGRAQSFAARLLKEAVRFMVKGARKYATTVGWDFARFNDGITAVWVALTGCLTCHAPAEHRGFVFTRHWSRTRVCLSLIALKAAISLSRSDLKFLLTCSGSGTWCDGLPADHWLQRRLPVQCAVRKLPPNPT